MVEHALDAGGAVESGAETETPRPELRARRHSRFLGRRWSRADKWRIVEESYQPGTSVSLVARRYDVNANQVFNWRREARDGRLGKPPVGVATRGEMEFIPLGVIGGDSGTASTICAPAMAVPANLPAPAHAGDTSGVIEIVLSGGVRVRVGPSVDDETLRRVLAVLQGTR